MTPQLRPALIFNAVFSLASGALMLLAAGTVADWLGVSGTGWLRLFGVVLVGHAILIAVLLPRLGIRKTAVLNLAAIGPYPLLLVLAIVIGLIDRPLGQGLALADAAVIAGVAAIHAMGLRKPQAGHQPQPA